jgi:NAD+ diphosphatase
MSRRHDFGPKPLLGYTASPIERAAERRADPEFVAALAARPDSGAYLVAGESIIFRRDAEGHAPRFPLTEALAWPDRGETVFLGLLDGVGLFGVWIDPAQADALKSRPDLFVSDLRTIAVQGLASAAHLSAIAEAKAMLLWHSRHRFCAVCGAATNVVDAGWRRECPACKASHFPRTDPVVIMLAVDRDRCLMGRQSRFPRGMWSCLAGFVEPGETIEEAVRREIHEEAGIVCGPVAYFASQPWPFPMSLMIGCHAVALSRDVKVDTTELEDARWFDREEVASMLLRQHPDGFAVPPPVAIAYHIVRAWVEEGTGALRAKDR